MRIAGTHDKNQGQRLRNRGRGKTAQKAKKSGDVSQALAKTAENSTETGRGSCRIDAAIPKGGSGFPTETVASSNAPTRAMRSCGRTKAIRSAINNIRNCAPRTVRYCLHSQAVQKALLGKVPSASVSLSRSLPRSISRL